mmetsp:Transcript_20760/g.47858  ORF Transcript_20760/g.47858 Transcript_20760/m.47858 type:complete len:107 (-) Transcript_20760:267-587(-)
MLHARLSGETFGLAVGEFAAHGKPVITSSEHTDRGRARAHLDNLGTRGLYYRDKASLLQLLLGFNRTEAAIRGRRGDWRAYAEFAPPLVMRQFSQVFLRREVPGVV